MLSKADRTLRNCLRWFVEYGVDSPQPLVVKPDRVFFHHGTLTQRLAELPGLTRWDAVRNHGDTALYGYREDRARASAQIIVHRECLEMDFDLWNPAYGAGPAAMHWLEVVGNAAFRRKTDPFKIAKLRGWT